MELRTANKCKIIISYFLILLGYIQVHSQNLDSVFKDISSSNAKLGTFFAYNTKVTSKFLLYEDTSSFETLVIAKFTHNDTLLINYNNDSDFYLLQTSKAQSYRVLDGKRFDYESNFGEHVKYSFFLTPVFFKDHLFRILKKKNVDSLYIASTKQKISIFAKVKLREKDSLFVNTEYTANQIMYQTIFYLDTLVQYKNTVTTGFIYDTLYLNEIIDRCFKNIRNNKLNEQEGLKDFDTIAINDLLAKSKLLNTNKAKLNAEFKLVYFWFLGCLPCRLSTKIVDAVDKKNDLINVITLNPIDTNEVAVIKYLKKYDYAFNVYLIPKELIENNVNAYPTILILDKQNNVIKKFVGFDKDLELELLNYLKLLTEGSK